MKLSNYCKGKGLFSLWDGVLWCYKESNFRGKKHTIKQIKATLPSFTHFHTSCSLLLITALNSSVNKTCWQHVTAFDIKTEYIKTWFMCGSQGSFIRLLQVHSSVLPCLWAASEASCLQKGQWLLCMQGSGCELEKRNRLNIMRPSSLSPRKKKNVHAWERKRNCMSGRECVVHMRNVCVLCWVWVCATFMSVARGGGISTAATSSDSNVTARLGLCRQCG